MTFLSVPFFLLLVLVLLCLKFTSTKEKQQKVLLISSYIFYGYWDIRFLFLMIFQTFISYRIALIIERCRDRGSERFCKLFTFIGVGISLGILGFFKYFNFFVDSFFQIFGFDQVSILKIILPVGISFYTFQALSYLLDVYRKDIEAKKNFWQVSLYIAFFPQLVAGPIVRSTDFLPQLNTAKKVTWDNFSKGTQIFLFGVIKKAVIADRLSVYVDSVYGAYGTYCGLTLVCATMAYAIQIYCDFSGYSDMAIGTAKMMGYDLCKNFNIPYLSSNPSEFWKRWHISLSSWFKDYVYIPMGGNRKGSGRTYVNLFITMALSGLWHGANWTFVLWGIFHGLACIVYQIFTKVKKKLGYEIKNKILFRAIKGISIILNFCSVCFLWIFFRAETVQDAWGIIKRIFTFSDGILYIYIYFPIFMALCVGISIWAYVKNKGNGYYLIMNMERFWPKVVICLIIWLILAFYYPGENSFIYFQF